MSLNLATQYQTNSDSFPTPKKEAIKELFMRLKKAHQFYKLYGSDPKKHEEILTKSEPLISELESLGVHRSFSEALLFFGKEFGAGEGKGKDEDIISRAEEIFGAKARPMTPEELKIHEQVPKDALIYTFKDGKPEVLAYGREG